MNIETCEKCAKQYSWCERKGNQWGQTRLIFGFQRIE